MDVMHLFESYSEFADLARAIRGYGDWSYTCDKVFNEFNEWLAVYNEGIVTREEMRLLEMKYKELHQDELKKEGGFINGKIRSIFKNSYRR